MSRWFAYLDVLGSLSGNKNDQPLGSFYWGWGENNLNTDRDDEDFQIDCLMGFSNRCIGILARIAELAKQCEAGRIDGNGDVVPDWRPESDVVEVAVRLRRELEEGIVRPARYKGCTHRGEEVEGQWDDAEVYATNEMFHWGGLIHLYRRVFGKEAGDPEVQHAVRQIMLLLEKVRRGSTAETCLLFPMFVAGCDALEDEQRENIMGRLRGVEEYGYAQVCFSS